MTQHTTLQKPDLSLLRRDHLATHAVQVGERIDLKALDATERLAASPLTVRAGEHGAAVLFRYGVVVMFGLTPIEQAAFLNHLEPFVLQRHTEPETESTEVLVRPELGEGIDKGTIVIREFNVERLQLIADVLAKSVTLATCEASVSEVFERIEPLAADLQRRGKGVWQSRGLLRHIGGALLIQHRTIGRVETVEKPELLWEHPELERLYKRLSDEYELPERQLALESKLTLISRTAETLLELLQNKRSLRVEWYIVILIVVEIILTLYEMFIRH